MRRGFSVLEFVIVAALLLAAATVLLPRALAPRRAVNEEQAPGYLAMIGAGERAWRAETGAYVPLHRLAEEPPARRAPGAVTTLTPLLSSGFIVDGAGIGHRAGFRFRLTRGAGGGVDGCWAWPNLRGYSGVAAYWADFDAGVVRRARAAPDWAVAPDASPEPEALEPETLLRF